MYQLMIVDDEQTILDGLSRVIPWNELGYEVAAKAHNGAEALAALEAQAIDVILTDIQMPDLSGLEIAERIREQGQNIKLVFISGYNKFEYAVRGIQLRVEDYILKPIDPKQVGRVFSALRQRMDEERSSRAAHLDTDELSARLIAGIEQAHAAEIEQAISDVMARLEQLPEQSSVLECQRVLTHLAQHFGMEPDAVLLPQDASAEDFPAHLSTCIDTICEHAGLFSELLCRKARLLIEANYSDKNFSLQSIARELHISYGYLSGQFTRFYHQSLKAYLIEVRMKRAKELILQRNMKIYEVAEEVGYSDSRYFSDAFRKHFGVSPTDYLGRIRSNRM